MSHNLIAAAHGAHHTLNLNLSHMLHSSMVFWVALCILLFCLPSMLGRSRSQS